MIKPTATRGLLWLVLLVFSLPLVAEDDRGRVSYLRGAVTATDDTGVPRILRADSRVRVGETIETADNSVVQIVFPDRSMMHLKPNTRLVVETFNYTPDRQQDDSVVVDMVKGSMRSLTGLVGKRNPAKVKYKTPVATIGIRGTVIEIDQVDDGPTTALFDIGTGYIVSSGQPEAALQAGQSGQVEQRGKQAQVSSFQRDPKDPAALAKKLVAANKATLAAETDVACSDLDPADVILMVAIEQNIPAATTDDIAATVGALSSCLPVDVTSTVLTTSTYLEPETGTALLESSIAAGTNVAIALESVLRGMEHATQDTIQDAIDSAINRGLDKNDARNILNNLTDEGICR